MLEKERKQAQQNGTDADKGKKATKDKKKKKKATYDKRDPVEIALENPELAHLDPERRKIIAEQIAVIKRPPAGFFELFRYSTKFEVFLNVVGIICAIAAGVAQPAMTILFGNLTTAFTDFGKNPGSPDARSRLFDEVNKDVLILVYIGIASFVATWIYMFTWIYTGETTTRRVRENYLQAILRQNIAFFDRLGPGEVTTRIETDTHLIQEGISDKIAISVFFIAIFISGFVIAIIRNWRLALVCSTIIPCIAVAGGVMNSFISKYKQQQLEETANGATLAEEVIASVRSAHAFGNQKRLADMYNEANERTLKIGLKSARFNGLGLGVFFFIIYGAYGLAFYYGTTLLLQGRITSGEIVNVFFSILIGAFSLAQLAPNLQAISFARGAATEIYATIDRVPVIDSSSEAGLKPESVKGLIELENIDFIYPSRPAVQVLYNFNGIFPPGKMTALVGGSGSGKSTIIGLLERFYDPVGGVVKIDGIPIKDWNIRYLRNQIGLVSQEPVLFATTVAGNIEHGLIGSRFEHETAEQKRARVIEAAKLANADGFITALPLGYDTLVGERAMLLSGGQKQRIAIARAIVSDPKILLLDEATSALDTNSETIVQDALDRASAGRTTVTIAHRLSTIRDADQIIVLTAGHILESAMSTETAKAHDILLENPDGAYSKLVNAQRLREMEEAEGGDESSSVAGSVEQPALPGELTREQLDEMARQEKPQFETLKRTGTGRSLASQALEKRQLDLEAAGGEQHVKRNFPYLIKRMFIINRDQWKEYTLGFCFAVASGCVYPVFGNLLTSLVATTGVFQQTGQKLRDDGNRYALYSFIIGIVATICVIGQSWFYGTTAERLSAKMRVGAFRAVLRQDIAFFDEERNSTGHLTAQLADLATKVYGLFGVTQGVIIQSVFTIVAGAIIGLCYSWKIALVGIACIPLTLSAGIVRLRVVVLKDQKNKQSHAASAQMACEAAGAIRTVASLTREEDCSRIYNHQLDAPMRDSNRTAIYSNAFYSLSQALSFFVIGLIFWFGSHQLVDSGLSVKAFFVAQISVIFGSIQAGNVFSYVPDMSSARGAAADYIELVDSIPAIDAEDPSGELFDFKNAKGHIRFENVHFRYPTRLKVPVLRGLDFEVKPGQFVAFCGASGCGKSTTIQLLERFYDPLSGRVLVDGKDISTLNVQSYRKAVALVQQEPTLYSGTIGFNIALGAFVPPEEVTQEQIEAAAKKANIHDFVKGLPDAYNTEVGGKGASLSGGQKQRVAIARALIRDPKILLLDEATSALDSESEKVVQRALDAAAKDRTTIAIAHRLSTIQNADCIYVLKDGVIAEAGSHDVLLSKRGLYYELVAQQSLEKQH
ncbi:P-loop containing nucleoside triphosphate hydrolase protein [Rhodotorula sp. JG-1b]|nr:P-loop containing nucleoside triphosphate hydrolase protein [Rhodotorula sp. JG-1b]